jgi:hypothetical protein
MSRAHIDDIGAQSLAGQLERALRACRRLEEKRDQGSTLQQVDLLAHLPVQGDESVRQIQQLGNLHRVEVGSGQEMAMREGEGPRADFVDAWRDRGH